DRDIGFVDDDVATGVVASTDSSSSAVRSKLVNVLQLDRGRSRTEVGVGGANKLQPGLNLRRPVIGAIIVVHVERTLRGHDEASRKIGSKPVASVVAPVEFVLHFARDLQAVGVGRNG